MRIRPDQARKGLHRESAQVEAEGVGATHLDAALDAVATHGTRDGFVFLVAVAPFDLPGAVGMDLAVINPERCQAWNLDQVNDLRGDDFLVAGIQQAIGRLKPIALESDALVVVEGVSA